MTEVHVWSRFVETIGAWEHYTVKCGATHRRLLGAGGRSDATVVATEDDLSDATCLHCLRAVRDAHLRRAEWSATIGRAALERYEQVKRQRARRTR